MTIVLAVGSHTCGEETEKATVARDVGGTRYDLRLEFSDDFDNLDNWIVESNGNVSVEDNWLVWDCFSRRGLAGTIWCTKKFSGPTVIEFDAVGLAGARNLNFILNASHSDGLLETTQARTGDYGQYHVFPNYIVTYLTPPREGAANAFWDTRWRIRFRRNPGFQLMSERFVDSDQAPGRQQRITYVMDGDGRISLFVDGTLLHAAVDRTSPYRSGYHGFRTWNSKVKYAGFRVYSIRSQTCGDK